MEQTEQRTKLTTNVEERSPQVKLAKFII